MSTTDVNETAPIPDDKTSNPRKAVWLRGLYMIIIAVLIGTAQSVLFLLALIQFILMLLDKGQENAQLAQFGETIGKWLAKAALFQTAKSDEKPWPFSPLD